MNDIISIITNAPLGTVNRNRETLTWNLECPRQIKVTCTRGCSYKQQSIRSAPWSVLTFSEKFDWTRAKQNFYRNRNLKNLIILIQKTQNNHISNSTKQKSAPWSVLTFYEKFDRTRVKPKCFTAPEERKM